MIELFNLVFLWHIQTQVEKSQLQSDHETSLQELAAVKAQLHSLQTEKSLLSNAQGDAQQKYQDLVAKYSELNQEHQRLITANKDLVQVSNNSMGYPFMISSIVLFFLYVLCNGTSETMQQLFGFINCVNES